MSKKQKNVLPVGPGKKILKALLIIAVAVVAIYAIYYFFHYYMYSAYKKYHKAYEYEEGTTFTALADSKPSVDGMKLVAENDNLKLYADTKTAYVAVYDKRNGETIYSNPLNADDDEIANKTNKNYLKSQMIVQYYNSDTVSGSYDSYSKCVKNGALEVEGIKDGIRFIYTIGDTSGEETINFVIPLEYRLLNDSIEVNVPVGHITETNGSVYRIQLLRYFAAAGLDEEGYIVVPNGSGSLINFNNGKASSANYNQYVYGIDPLIANYTTIETTKDARLPIYALCRKNSSVLASIESGATLSLITANTSGSSNSYNYAYSTFVVRNADNLRMFGDNSQDVYVMEKQPYNVDCTVRYTFLTDDNKGYSGVANYYRNRLISEGNLTVNNVTGDIPFYMDVISGITETGHMLGVQYLHTFAMTSFDEAGEISDKLKAAGISNQVMNLQGWFNGGYYHDAAHDIKGVYKFGGKSDLEALNEKVAQNGGRMYADVAFQHVTYADDGFKYKTESSRYYSGYVVGFGVINPTTLRNTASLGYMEREYDLVSPKFLPRYVSKFAGKFTKYDVDGISLRDLGYELQSDKRRTNIIDREQALQIVLGQFDTLEATGKNLMNNEANAYAFKYSDDIINAPLYANTYKLVDEEIPLYAMILHGCIPYSSDLLNYEDQTNMKDAILHMIESGASPHYVFTYKESSLMKDTALNHYFSTSFDVWEKEAEKVYGEVNAVLKNVSGSTIVSHEILPSGLRKVTYDNGVVIYVNYTDEAITEGGVTVGAYGYEMEGK